MSFLRDLRVAVHSLTRTPGLAITVILTLSLGIGANAAIFTLVRGVLLKPLVNRDENRLIYIRQSAPGIPDENTAFSVPEIQDLRAGVKTLSAFGDFSTMGFTMVGLGEPRSIQGGVVSGTFFDVMGLHPVLGRLIGPQDDGPNAAGVVVLTYRFWATALGKDPSVIGKTVRLGSIGELRRMLLAESLVLCGAGALIGVVSAQPMVTMLARYASRFSVRALDLTVDSSLLWVGAALAIVAAVILAFVPRLPSSASSSGLGLSSGTVRITSGTNRRQQVFAVTQIAASFMLLVGASALISTLIALQRTQTGLDTRRVLAIDVPTMSYGKTPQQVVDFYTEAMRRIDALPGVNRTAFGNVVPWREGNPTGPGLQFSGDGHVHAAGVEDPRAGWRIISPGYFAALGVPIVAGRDFNALDGKNNDDPVVIVSQTLAQRMFPNQDPINRHVFWTDPVLQFFPGTDADKAHLIAPHRIIGVAADVDDDHLVPEPTVTVYNPLAGGLTMGGRLFIHTSSDPYALVAPITRLIRSMSADQPVEHAATLEDVRAEVLTPDRLNSVVFGVFAAVALAIAVVGVAGVLAFSVSARTREFGIRLALGSEPQRLLKGVIKEGAAMAAMGVFAGAVFGFVAARLAGNYFAEMKMPGALPVFISAFLLMTVAVVASLLPAARAARVNVMEALRSE